MRLTTLLLICGCLVSLTACKNFQHPLDWEASDLKPQLLGSWDAMPNGEPDKVTLNITQAEGTLTFRLLFHRPQASRIKQDKTIERATVQGRVLASGGIHVVELHSETYEEFDIDGESVGKGAPGYRFLRLTLAEGNQSLTLKGIEVDQFAALVVDSPLTEDVTYPAMEYMNCSDGSTRMDYFSSWLIELHEQGHIALQDENPDTLNELKSVSDAFNSSSVQPFRELKRLHVCLALKLPSDTLGKVFETYTEEVFTKQHEYSPQRF